MRKTTSALAPLHTVIDAGTVMLMLDLISVSISIAARWCKCHESPHHRALGALMQEQGGWEALLAPLWV